MILPIYTYGQGVLKKEAEEIDNENWLFEAAEFGEIYHNILILLLP